MQHTDITYLIVRMRSFGISEHDKHRIYSMEINVLRRMAK